VYVRAGERETERERLRERERERKRERERESANDFVCVRVCSIWKEREEKRDER